MTSLALPQTAAKVTAARATLMSRQGTLARYGLGLALLAAAAAAMMAIDPRTLPSGINVWMKPTKFLVSVSIFALTMAWYFGFVRPERRGSPSMRVTAAVLIASGTFELAWIGWQGANGLESHFNVDTPFYALMYGLMGLFALILTATTLPLAWEIARRPAAHVSRDLQAALVIGLVLTFLLGAGFGIAVAVNGGHSVGPEAGAVPVFGWNRSGGDLRIAHFVGIHAQQAIPLLAFAARILPERRRWQVLIVGTAGYVGVAVALFAQAAVGMPLLPL
ncbi:hypothetical protein [Sphingosinicella terrae]|uniref:hypothetical protein n=1 Tax=Sphingosinicella terrae TaxID=2172047 RepID=UPI000E0E088A|nr:hypothetical protein [Sphingosinicella terrae]